jgi:hypothetical protein
MVHAVANVITAVVMVGRIVKPGMHMVFDACGIDRIAG